MVQPLFTAGEGVARWKQGRLVREAAEHALRGIVNEVLLEVRERFYDALLAKAQVEVRKQSVSLLEEELALERNRFEAGTVPEFNVLRAEVEVANAQTPLIQARNNLRLSLEELSLVLGEKNKSADDIQVALRVRGDLEYREPLFDLPQSLADAKKQRPELQRLALLRDIEKSNVNVERSAFFPKLFGVAAYDWASSRFTDDLSETDHGWRVGLRAEWNVFDSLRTKGKFDQARARMRSAEVTFEEKEKEIEVEVRRALSDLLEARELVIASRKVVTRAEESLRQAKARLQSGAGRQIDVLDTQVALTDARTNQIEALHALNTAQARLEKATGENLQRGTRTE